MTTQLTFQSTALTAISHNNQTYIASSDIANALGYARPDSVNKIFERNQDEFTSGMVDHVKLTLSDNLKTTVRIFSLRGCHLIAMLARTPVAKEFRRWVLDLIDKEMSQNSAEKQPLAQHHQLLTRLYAIANEAHTFVQAINRKGGLGEKIDFDLGCGSYRYNLNMPTKCVLEQVKPLLQAQSEQLMQQRAMQSLNLF